MKPGDRVSFVLGLGYSEGTVLRVNEKTVVILLKNGMEVKRHIEKHGVECLNT
jgi:hypothetical protein